MVFRLSIISIKRIKILFFFVPLVIFILIFLYPTDLFSACCEGDCCCGSGECGSQCSHGTCPNGNNCCCSPNAPSGYGSDCSGSSTTVECGCCCNSATYYRCCNPNCSCTPTCPSGWSTTYNSDYNCEPRRKTCTKPSDGCGGTCSPNYGINVECYKPEPNFAPPTPSDLYLCYSAPSNKQCIPLSKNSSLPTRIVLPSSTEDIYIKTNAQTVPAGSQSRGMRYMFRINNHQNNWDSDCNPINTGDYCGGWRSENHTENLNAGDGNDIDLKVGNYYHVWAHAGTLDKCDGQVKTDWSAVNAYFKINTPPTVVSVSPSSGLSGNEPDEDTSSSCNDHNPQVFTTVFEDADGCNDMTIEGLWIDESAPNLANRADSMHGAVKSGSDIRIYAEGTTSSGGYPIMELAINNVPVKYFHDVSSASYYDYRHSAPVSLSEIRIRFVNDDGARDLKIDKIMLDGNIYETETNATKNDCGGTSQNEWLYCNWGYQQFSGTDKISSGKRFYGFDYIDQGYTCGGTAEDCYKNYIWNMPHGGYSIPKTTPKLCSPSGTGTDDQKGNTCNNADNTAVAWSATQASCSGNRLTVKWKVTFYDYLDSSTNIYDLYTIVQDKLGERNSGSWTDMGDRELDLNPPDTNVNIEHRTGEGDPADSLHFLQRATDEDGDDSGLRRVFDRFYEIDRDGTTTKCGIADGDCSSPGGGQITLSGSPPRWLDASEKDNMRTGFEGGDTVSASLMAEDVACNLSGENVNTSPQIGHEWMQTKFGDTYAALGYADPIQPAGVPFSSFWAGGDMDNNGPWDFGAGVDSDYGWDSRSYNDSNRAPSWYDTLYRLARKSDWSAVHGIQGISSISDFSGDGIFMYPGSGTVTLSGNCNGTRVLFLPTAQAEIIPDVKYGDDDSACLIVSRGNVTVLPGGDASNAENEDVVTMAVITDGKFTSQWDPNFDKLRMRGFVFADETDFMRDLVFEANQTEPAELIVYDPRYLYLMRNMLGERPFEQFECGTAQGVDLCTGW